MLFTVFGSLLVVLAIAWILKDVIKHKRILGRFSVDRYYAMTEHQLELEASKYHIGGYASSRGRVIREEIIRQLLAKDLANNSRFASFIALFAALISLIALFVSVISLAKP